MSSRVLLLLAVGLCASAYGDSFDVQIGAFRNPDVVQIELRTNAGELRRMSGADGLTRFVVGPFASRGAAEQARDDLIAAGFGGAFIRAHEADGDAPSPGGTARGPASAAAAASSPSQRDLDLLMSLSEEERRNLVYLDGRLHRKVGDEFIPYRE